VTIKWRILLCVANSDNTRNLPLVLDICSLSRQHCSVETRCGQFATNERWLLSNPIGNLGRGTIPMKVFVLFTVCGHGTCSQSTMVLNFSYKHERIHHLISSNRKVSICFVVILRGPFEKFVDSPYCSESEIFGGAVTVSFSKYLPQKAMRFLQRQPTSRKRAADYLLQVSGG
jgi:hypothetical protein